MSQIISDNSKAVAVVTGAARGIGRALVETLYGKGYYVVAVVRNPADVNVLSAIAPGYIFPLCCDITQPLAEETLQEFLDRHTKKVDLLINNAGVDTKGRGISGLSLETLDLDLAVHCYGAIRCVRACLPFLRASSGALILSMSSSYASIELIASGKVGNEQVNHSYKIAQGASNMLTALLAAELRNENIRVLSFDPGPVKTRMGPADAKTEPEDVAQAIIDLAEKNSDTGVFLHISEGKVPW